MHDVALLVFENFPMSHAIHTLLVDEYSLGWHALT
jgi:hypothetical protein